MKIVEQYPHIKILYQHRMISTRQGYRVILSFRNFLATGLRMEFDTAIIT